MSNLPTAPVVFQGETSLAPTSAGEVTDLLRYALEMGRDAETMERLVALHERITDRAAATEFAHALAEFQNECPPIGKGRTAKIPTSSGGTFTYTFANLSDIVSIVRPLLHRRGFSFTFDSEPRERLVSATCTLRHVNGHSATASFAVPFDSKSGAMSEQHKYSSALSFAKRIALVEVLGIITADVVSEDDVNAEPIMPEQVEALKQLASDVGADVPKFLKFMNASRFEDITHGDYRRAQAALESKRKAAQK